jgi:hypothetical protein
MRIAKGKVGERVQKQQDDCNARIDELTKRREKLLAELGARRLTDDAIAEIMQYARDVREGIQNPDLDTKRRVLESLGVKVTIKEGRYFIKCLIGETQGAIRNVAKRQKSTAIVNHRLRSM